MSNIKRIKVSIVAYMDNELPPTIKDLFNKADKPENIDVYIYNQDTVDYVYKGKYNVNIFHITPEDSDGYSSCRYELNEEIIKDGDDKDYYLQVAPHSRFAENWDSILIEEYETLAKENDKFILCHRQHEYDLPNNIRSAPYFYAPIIDWNTQTITGREKTSIISDKTFEVTSFQAGGVFCKLDWVKDVKVNPEIFLWGEETDIPLRTFGAGYKMFHLHKPVCYHLYHQKNRKQVGRLYEPERYETRNNRGKKIVFNKLINYEYHKQKEWMELNNLNYNKLYEVYNQFINGYNLTAEQSNFCNNVDNRVTQMKLDGVINKNFDELLFAINKINDIITDYEKKLNKNLTN